MTFTIPARYLLLRNLEIASGKSGSIRQIDLHDVIRPSLGVCSPFVLTDNAKHSMPKCLLRSKIII